MKKEYSVILLTASGDFLLEEEENLFMEEYGVQAENPYILNEDEKAQKIKAEKVFIPYSSLDNIQYGQFEQETV